MIRFAPPEVFGQGGDMPHPISPYARTAFAQGWAASAGPMTERVKAGCVAAVELACEHADDPNILEVTLHLGKLEGTWARVFDRREAMYTAHTAAVADAWRALAGQVDFADLAARFRAFMGYPAPTTESVDTDRKQRRDQIAQSVIAWLLMLLLHPGQPLYQALAAILAAALRAARAEGTAGALAVAADTAGILDPLDMDGAAADADRALTGSTVDAATAAALAALVDGIALEVGRRLADLAEQGATNSDLETEARQRLSDPAVLAVVVDFLLGKAFGDGTVDALRAAGVEQLSWLSAGDGRVCQACLNNEADSPYPITDLPSMPAHPRCRCVWVSDGPLPDDAVFGDYLNPGDT